MARPSPSPKVAARIALGERRIQNILRRHGIANSRTLEQKISDAGPFNQRVEPLYLTQSRNNLQHSGLLQIRRHAGTDWYHLIHSPPDLINDRLALQLPIYRRLRLKNLPKRVGQALEILVYQSLCNQDALFHFGAFPDLDDHDDSILYRKEEPPRSVSDKKLLGETLLDFLLIDPRFGPLGVEVKNVRPWIYPDSNELRELLLKCCAIDAVPVLVARRLAYVTMTEVFQPCGIIAHQTYYQLYPISAAELADQARHKNLLGYHDIRLRNDPLPRTRLDTFITRDLPAVLPVAHEKFHRHKDLLLEFACGAITYPAFHSRLRKRL